MADIHPLPDLDRLECEAADWIARMNADVVSDDDRARFTAWRAAHASHARTYDGMCETWRAFSAAGPLVRAVSLGQSLNEATTPTRSRWWLGAIAASLIAVASSLLLWHVWPDNSFQTGIGEHASIALPDGTTVVLNSDSRVNVDYSAQNRIIRLDRGEAFFKVIHDPSRPFWVYAGGAWVRDVGTQFSVYLRPNDVRVTVAQGLVEVGSGEAPGMGPLGLDPAFARAISTLNADEQADIWDGTARIRALPPFAVDRMLAWRHGKVSFQNQPLGEVIREMSRYTTLKIVVRNPKLQKLMIGGTFPTNPQGVETLLSMLHDGFGLQVRKELGRAYIEAPAPHRSFAFRNSNSTSN